MAEFECIKWVEGVQKSPALAGLVFFALKKDYFFLAAAFLAAFLGAAFLAAFFAVAMFFRFNG